MARIELENADMAGLGAGTNADIIFEMGLAFASGRNGEMDLVSAHKWLNIAAIKGSARAAAMRTEIAQTMTKPELASALRQARQWMTEH